MNRNKLLNTRPKKLTVPLLVALNKNKIKQNIIFMFEIFLASKIGFKKKNPKIIKDENINDKSNEKGAFKIELLSK